MFFPLAGATAGAFVVEGVASVVCAGAAVGLDVPGLAGVVPDPGLAVCAWANGLGTLRPRPRLRAMARRMDR